MPPTTEAIQPFRSSSRPILGWMEVSWPLKMPAIAAYTAPMKNTTAITTVVLIPTTLDTSSSSPMARTAVPKAVFLRRSSNPVNPVMATPMAKTLNPLMLAPAMVKESLPKASGNGRGALLNTIVMKAVMASRMPREATSMTRGEFDRWRMYTYRPRYRASPTAPASRHDTTQLRYRLEPGALATRKPQ